MKFLMNPLEEPMTARIRIAQVQAHGQDPVLVKAECPDPGPGGVLVRLRAASLNFADLLMTKGQYQERRDFPYVPGLEGSGEVIAAPEGSGLRTGDRVAVCAQGTLAEVMAVPAVFCTPIPDSMSHEQAAGFQIAYGTSHLALAFRAGLQPGETLVVLGAAGGVGLTAVEVGRAMGARVIAIARGTDRLDIVRAAGAEHVIDSAECDDLKAALRALGGADVVYDPVGDSAGEAAFAALRQGGRFLVIGFAGGKPPALPLNHALVKNIAIHGFYWGAYRSLDPLQMQASMVELFAMFAAGRLSPVAGHILPFEQVAEGYELLRSRKSVGKIVITL